MQEAQGKTDDLKQADNSWEFLPLDEAFCGVPEASMVVANSADERMEAVFERVVALWEDGVDPADVVIMTSCPESASYLQAYLMECIEAEAVMQGYFEDDEGADGEESSGSVVDSVLAENGCDCGIHHHGDDEQDCVSDEADPYADLANFMTAVTVTWARDVACSVLATSEAQAVIGREFFGSGPRILSAFEEDFLMEDLKTWGSRPGRLREMCKFLYRGMTELADEAPHWLFMVEEIEIYRFMCHELEYLGAVLEPEVSNLATKALRGNEDLLADFASPHVIAYDYQYMSRASQLLCHLIATESLLAVAGVNTTVAVFESYPFGRGVEEFTRINPDAEVTWMGVSGAPVKKHLTWPDTAAEFTGVAEAVEQKIAEGAAPESIGVVCFHPYWASRVQHALAGYNVPVNSWYAALSLRGDIRDNALCAPLRVITLLRLLVDKHDSVAWRAWFGFGDYLARSAEFKEVREAAQAQDPAATFAPVAQESAWGATVLDALRACEGLRGEDLLQALLGLASIGALDPEAMVGAEDDAVLRAPSNAASKSHTEDVPLVRAQSGTDTTTALPSLLRPLLALGTEATAEDMISHLETLQFAGGLLPDECVVVTSLAGAASLTFDMLFVVGFVNGLFPVHDFFDLTKITVDKQNKMAADNDETVELLKMLARNEVVASTFETIDVDLARRAHVKQDRIFQDEAGTHKSDVSESVCLPALLK